MIRTLLLILLLVAFTQPAQAQLFPGSNGEQVDQVNTDPILKTGPSLAKIDTDPVLKTIDLSTAMIVVDSLTKAGNDITVEMHEVKGVQSLVLFQNGQKLQTYTIKCLDCGIEFEY